MASAAIATALNPANPAETVLFTVTTELQLTIQRRPVDQSASTTYPDNCAAIGAPVNGPVAQPASLAAVNFRKITHLYGFTSYIPKGSTTPVNLVTLLSPYLNPILKADTASIQTVYGAIAAVGDLGNPKVCYVYYLKDRTAGGKNPQIMQATINDNVAMVKEFGSPTPDPQSNLGVAVDSAGNRYVFYQDGPSKTISYINVTTGTITPITNTFNSFKSGTSLAVTSGVLKGKFTMWIYYQSAANSLIRLTGTDKWIYEILQSPTALNQSTPVAASLDSGVANNHIFYVPSSDPQITEVVDNCENPIKGDKVDQA